VRAAYPPLPVSENALSAVLSHADVLPELYLIEGACGITSPV
jgi:hypothetical protein